MDDHHQIEHLSISRQQPLEYLNWESGNQYHQMRWSRHLVDAVRWRHSILGMATHWTINYITITSIRKRIWRNDFSWYYVRKEGYSKVCGQCNSQQCKNIYELMKARKYTSHSHEDGWWHGVVTQVFVSFAFPISLWWAHSSLITVSKTLLIIKKKIWDLVPE